MNTLLPSGKIAIYEDFKANMEDMYKAILANRLEFIQIEIAGFPDITCRINEDLQECYFARDVFIVAVGIIHLDGIMGTKSSASFIFNRDIQTLNRVWI